MRIACVSAPGADAGAHRDQRGAIAEAEACSRGQWKVRGSNFGLGQMRDRLALAEGLGLGARGKMNFSSPK